MWIDNIVQWLLPKETHFFDDLEKSSQQAVETAKQLERFVDGKNQSNLASIYQEIRTVEEEADKHYEALYKKLSETFITPIDRGDIQTLADALEGITDTIKGFATQCTEYGVTQFPAEDIQLARAVREGCEAIHAGTQKLRNNKTRHEAAADCRKSVECRDQGEKIYHTLMIKLYAEEKDAVALLKRAGTLARMYRILSQCRESARVLEHIIVKNS